MSDGSRDELTIRSVEDADFAALHQMYCQVIADGGGTPIGGQTSPEAFREGWLRDRDVYVAWRENCAVGTYFIRPNFPAFAAHIAQSGYIVSHKARRQGIGRALLADSLRRAKASGYTAMMFNLVFESNPSRRLYEAAGFRVVGRVPQARGAEDALIYWRRL